MAHDGKFWDRIADKYFAKPIEDLAAYEEKIAATRVHLGTDKDALEIGCGTGGTAIRHAPYVRRIHAVDISAEMLRIARREAAAKGVGNITFELADAASIDPGPATHDVVLGLSLLHLVEDPAELTRRVHRWLRPGGVFVTSTAVIRDKMGWFRFIAPIGRAIGKIPYVNIFRRSDLLRFMTDAGFVPETEKPSRDGVTTFLICRKPA